MTFMGLVMCLRQSQMLMLKSTCTGVVLPRGGGRGGEGGHNVLQAIAHTHCYCLCLSATVGIFVYVVVVLCMWVGGGMGAGMGGYRT